MGRLLLLLATIVLPLAHAEPGLRYEGGIYLDSDRNLLFGPQHTQRNLTFLNLRAGNTVQILLEWSPGANRDIVLRVYDQADGSLGASERVSPTSARMTLGGLDERSEYRIEAIARMGSFAEEDRISVTLTSQIPNGIEFRDATSSPNHPPTIHGGIRFSVKERETLSVSLADSRYVSDEDNDTLTFEWVGVRPSWLTLSSVGELVARPISEHVGGHSFSIRVSDGRAQTVGRVQINVTSDPLPPPPPPPPAETVYFIHFLTDSMGATGCPLMRRGVEQVLLRELETEEIRVLLLGHECLSDNKYSARIFAESASSRGIARLHDVARRMHGNLIMQNEIVFRRMTGIDLARNLSLSQGYYPVYGTGYSATERFTSAVRAGEAMAREGREATYDSLFLDLARRFFPSKVAEVTHWMARSNTRSIYYSITVRQTEPPWNTSFVVRPTDIVARPR